MKLATKVLAPAILILFGLILTELALRAGGGIYTYLQHRQRKTPQYSDGEIRIVCLGESTTAWGLADSYPAQLQKILNGRYPQKKTLVFNEGQTGATTRRLLDSLPELLSKYHPQFVVMMMGINDPVFLSGRETFFSQMRLVKFAILLWTNLDHFRLRPDEKVFLQGTQIYYDNHLDSRFSVEQPQVTASALKLFEEAERLDPSDPRPHKFIGSIYPGSERELKRAMELGMVDTDIYEGLAEIYRNEKRVDEGLRILSEGVARFKDACHLRSFLIIDAIASKDFDVARQAILEGKSNCSSDAEIVRDAEILAKVTHTAPLIQNENLFFDTLG